MKAINTIDLEIGEQDIPISVYSSIERETGFKQLSNCCNSSVNYKKVCSSCAKELSAEEIHKAIEIGKNEFKDVDTDKIKAENTNLKVLGIAEEQMNEEDGYVRNGTTWFIGIQQDKKNKGKTERNNKKFSYLREALKLSGKCLVCALVVRNKEHIVLLKPYFEGFVGVGLYYFEQVRDIKEISGYGMATDLDKKSIETMAENLKMKTNISMKEILNKRSQIIEEMVVNGEATKVVEAEQEVENPTELVNF